MLIFSLFFHYFLIFWLYHNLHLLYNNLAKKKNLKSLEKVAKMRKWALLALGRAYWRLFIFPWNTVSDPFFAFFGPTDLIIMLYICSDVVAVSLSLSNYLSCSSSSSPGCFDRPLSPLSGDSPSLLIFRPYTVYCILSHSQCIYHPQFFNLENSKIMFFFALSRREETSPQSWSFTVHFAPTKRFFWKKKLRIFKFPPAK